MSVGIREKVAALRQAATFRPILAAWIVVLSLGSALLEGVGVGFILPIVEHTQTAGGGGSGRLLTFFQRAYELAGIPFELPYLIGGVAVVMTIRFGLSFLVAWLRAALDTGYQRALRQRLYEALLYAPIGYIDRSGSDELLNTLVTETNRAGTIVSGVIDVFETALRGLIYLVLAAVISTRLTLIALVSLGASTLFVRMVLEPAYAVGDDVADANERFQSVSQAGIQGMRDARLFNMRGELIDGMRDALGQFYDAGVRLKRNQAAMQSLNQLSNALVVFGLIYVGIAMSELSIAEIGVFLFAVYRLSPTLSQINNMLYRLDGMLPHLVRVQHTVAELERAARPDMEGGESVEGVEHLEVDDLVFSYGDEPVLEDVSFEVSRGESIALVGQSGAGKSTIVALLGRLQEPDAGAIRADGTPIADLDVTDWRDRLAVVRQDPFVFDATLRENVTVGRRDASRGEIERACEIAQVTEFVDDLPNGYETELGENGVRLSGGQRQRVAIARALLKDADVLLLDEATSELDSHIERDVHAGIRETEDDYAVLSIAHQLSTVNDADRIYTLEDGTVTDVGTHEELLDREGTYADLYATQS